MQQVKKLTISGLSLISAEQSITKKTKKEEEVEWLQLYDYFLRDGNGHEITITCSPEKYEFDKQYKLVLEAIDTNGFQVYSIITRAIEATERQVSFLKKDNYYYTEITVWFEKKHLPDQLLLNRNFSIVLEEAESSEEENIVCEYEEILPSFKEFLANPYYLGEFSKKHCQVFPYWLRQIEVIEKAHIPMIAYIGDAALGKTTAQLLYAIYDFCKLQCMGNPNEQLQLLGDIDFYIVHKNPKIANDLLGFVEGILYGMPFLQDLQKENRYKQHIKFKAICTEMLSVCRTANIATIVLDDIQDSDYDNIIDTIKMLQRMKYLTANGSIDSRWGFERHLLLNGNISQCGKLKDGLDLFSVDIVRPTLEKVKPVLFKEIQRIEQLSEKDKEPTESTEDSSKEPDWNTVNLKKYNIKYLSDLVKSLGWQMQPEADRLLVYTMSGNIILKPEQEFYTEQQLDEIKIFLKALKEKEIELAVFKASNSPACISFENFH